MTIVSSIPVSKRALCAGCGTAVWRSSTSAVVQYCLTCRRAGAAPSSAAHGTTGRYKLGCRCRVCKDGVNERQRVYAATRTAQGRPLSQSRRTVPRVCEMCRVEFGARVDAVKAGRGRFCSVICRNRVSSGWSTSRDVVLYVPPPKPIPTWSGVVVPSSQGFSAGRCDECGDEFVRQGRTSFCSRRCRDRAGRRRHRLGRGKFSVSSQVRYEIYERDGWVCQLCFDPVDPSVDTLDRWGHTLDHIIPQSHQLVPDHSPQNLRLAHRICNSLRGDGTEEVDYGSQVEGGRPRRGRASASA